MTAIRAVIRKAVNTTDVVRVAVVSLTSSQLQAIDSAKEVVIRTYSGEKSVGTVIWVVVVGEEVFVRSVRADAGAWYQRALQEPSVILEVDSETIDFQVEHVGDPEVIEAVTRALRDKYSPGGSLDRMTRHEVLDHTLRLVPSDS